MFETAYLHSREDLDKLRELRQIYEPSYIFTYLRYVTVQFRHDAWPPEPMPLFPALSTTFPRLEGVRYIRDTPNEEKVRISSPDRSSPSQLAVTYKGFYKRLLTHPTNLTNLYLSNIVFHSLADLLRICGALHLLTTLHLETVTWDHTPRMIRAVDKLYHSLREVKTYRCSGCRLLWLWSSFGCANSDRDVCYKIHSDDLYTAGALADRLNMASADVRVTITCKQPADRTCKYTFIVPSRFLVV